MIVTFMIMTNMTLKSLPKAEKTMESIRIHSLELGYFKTSTKVSSVTAVSGFKIQT